MTIIFVLAVFICSVSIVLLADWLFGNDFYWAKKRIEKRIDNIDWHLSGCSIYSKGKKENITFVYKEKTFSVYTKVVTNETFYKCFEVWINEECACIMHILKGDIYCRVIKYAHNRDSDEIRKIIKAANKAINKERAKYYTTLDNQSYFK